MPSLPAGAIERCLTRKLRAVERAGDHRFFEIYDDDGRVIASTAMSRSWRGSTMLGPRMVAIIQQELRLRGHAKEFGELIACPLSRDNYLSLVKSEQDSGHD